MSGHMTHETTLLCANQTVSEPLKRQSHSQDLSVCLLEECSDPSPLIGGSV